MYYLKKKECFKLFTAVLNKKKAERTDEYSIGQKKGENKKSIGQNC